MKCKVADHRGLLHGYFGVFDGHGGAECSEYCADHLHDNVMNSTFLTHDVLAAMQDGFLQTDAELLDAASAQPRRKGYDAGTAAVCMFATPDKLLLAHAGDCRAVLVRRSGSAGQSYVELTNDHSAERAQSSEGGHFLRPDEVVRVRRAGGLMDMGGYVSVHEGGHSLPMTRALGDLPLKVAGNRNWRKTCVNDQIVTALPEVSARHRSADDLCVVLATDGLFGNIMPSEVVADVARHHLETVCVGAPDAEKQTARVLCEAAINEYWGVDNVSVVVISLAPPPPSSGPAASSTCILTGHSGHPHGWASPPDQHESHVWPSLNPSMASTGPPSHAPNAAEPFALPLSDADVAPPFDFFSSMMMRASRVGAAPTNAQGTSAAAVDPAPSWRSLSYRDALAGPVALAWQESQDSVLTADPCSPVGRHALRDKLQQMFCRAFPPTDADEEAADPDEADSWPPGDSPCFSSEATLLFGGSRSLFLSPMKDDERERAASSEQ
jgi:serine/threonine protein phosphatase PrpC